MCSSPSKKNRDRLRLLAFRRRSYSAGVILSRRHLGTDLCSTVVLPKAVCLEADSVLSFVPDVDAAEDRVGASPAYLSPGLRLLEDVVETVRSHQSLLDMFVSSCRPDEDLKDQRRRDIFPLPFLTEPFDSSPVPDGVPLILMLTNNAVLGLNSLYGCQVDPNATRPPILAQRVVQKRLWHKCCRFVVRFHALGDVASGAESLASFTNTEVAAVGRLVADSVDLLASSGKVDPVPFLSAEAKDSLLGSKLFPDRSANLRKFPDVKQKDRAEYIRLVARQLRCGKVDLCKHIVGGGTVFTVAKRDSAKVREVWHGAKVSAAALPPLAPLHLASPSALLDLEATAAAPVRLTKRDGRVLFDQLRLPLELRKFMGRPAVRVQELVDTGGLSLEEVSNFLSMPGPIHPDCKLYPRSCCWPMGFSWSSHVAQSTMLAVCRSAGLREKQVLADDAPAPRCLSHVFALATDDVMEFTCLGAEYATKSAERLDRAFDRVGILKNVSKDVTGDLNGTCIGVDLVAGLSLAPSITKLATLLAALVELCKDPHSNPHMAPYNLAAILGVVQWFDQLNRPLFSVLDTVYQFCRLSRPRTAQPLLKSHVAELIMVLCLAPLWEADLTREWLGEVEATDASTTFGFGICSLKCSPLLAKRLGRLSEKRGDFVRLNPDAGSDGERRDRIGNPHHLNLPKCSFKTVLSQRCKHKATPGALEAGALVLLLRWLTRSHWKHASRVPVLVDAKAVLAAASKGRSSARTIQRQMRKLAALTLAGDFLIRYLYVPTEDNPADEPSRGTVRESRRSSESRRSCETNVVHSDYVMSVSEVQRMEQNFKLHFGAEVSSFL
jgi:hypothetical protein